MLAGAAWFLADEIGGMVGRCTLAFVWVRVMAQFETALFGFMPTQELRGTTREWLSWWPSARQLFHRKS